MALKELLTNLESNTTAGIIESNPFHNQFNNGGSENGNSTSLFDNFQFRQKSFKFGKGKTSDQINGGFSQQPFIKSSLLDVDNSSYDIPRGGLKFAGERSKIDKKRIEKFLETPIGNNFKLTQKGLQRMNPKIDVKPTGAVTLNEGGLDVNLNGTETLIYNTENRFYNSKNTLNQVRRNHLGLHFDRSGVLPTGINAINIPLTSYKNVAIKADRLKGLYGSHMLEVRPSDVLDVFGLGNTGVARFFDKAVNTVNNFVDKVEDVLGFEDTSILYRYASGPSSILGIGRTTIRNFQNSKGNPSKFREDLNGDEKIYPLTINPLKTLGRVDELEPDIESLKLHRTKTNHISKKNYREVKYSTGNPGIINIKTKKYNTKNPLTIDKINENPIISEKHDKNTIRDFIRFYFDIYTGSSTSFKRIQFRAFLDSFGDNYQGNWNEFNYAGRGEPFFTYNNFKRSTNFSFKIAAQTRHELNPLYQKLNYLVSTTAPTYGNNDRMRGTYVKVTIGQLLNNVPGFFNSIDLSWNTNYPWEIKLTEDEVEDTQKDNPFQNTIEQAASALGVIGNLDNDVYQNPHVLEVNCNFTPIHNFVPQTSTDKSPFIIPQGTSFFNPNIFPEGFSVSSPGSIIESEVDPFAEDLILGTEGY